MPALADVRFSQCGVDITCRPGAFIIERGHDPYVFGHAQSNDLWVLKVPGDALRGRIRAPDRFSTLQFDATGGVGALFVDLLHLIPGRFEQMTPEAHKSVGQQLIDLLVLALRSDERALFSAASGVREAHLARIERYVRENLARKELAPEQVAAACGISVRYLHELFRDTNQTLGAWIREQRLIAARQALEDRSCNLTITEIAYAGALVTMPSSRGCSELRSGDPVGVPPAGVRRTNVMTTGDDDRAGCRSGRAPSRDPTPHDGTPRVGVSGLAKGSTRPTWLSARSIPKRRQAIGIGAWCAAQTDDET